VEWQLPTSSLTLPLAAVNATPFASLDLHLAPNVTWRFPQTQPALAVVLRDHGGGAARVEIPATVPALRQFDPDAIYGPTSPLYPSSLRIPLGQFRGVDLSALAAVELVFDHTPRGQLHLAGIDLVR
jgi:hypothetical protein